MSDEDDFLSRWSRRKRRVAKEEMPSDADLPEAEQTESADLEVEPETEEQEAALLAKLGLPKPETLGRGDDFKAFMQAGIPQFLRRRALRVLWRSNPVLANLDGLNDYDDDYTSPEWNRKIVATAYKIGRGFLPGQQGSEILHTNTEKDTDEVSEAVADPGEIEPENPEPQTGEEAISPNSDVELSDEEKSFSPKRMRFTT